MMHRNRSVDTHQFSMIPRADIPRSSFRIQTTYKTTFDAGRLIPVFLEEVLPGDKFSVNMTAFARLATPLFPIMDNMYLESFWFFVPNRLVWDHWQNFMGERYPAVDSSIDFVIPTMESPQGGWPINTLGDYFGLPTDGQVDNDSVVEHSCLPFRGYNLIWNDWFRDENLQGAAFFTRDDGPDDADDYLTSLTTDDGCLPRNKRHDYFTSCLPFVQKGDPVPLPLGGTADVVTNNQVIKMTNTGVVGADQELRGVMGSRGITVGVAVANEGERFKFGDSTGLMADLTTATSTTINMIRQAFQIQKLLERDARGGTRYTEIIRQHFGVVSPDARLQRPEFLGSGSTAIAINPVAQTSATSGTDTPQGNLAAIGTALHRVGFTQAFTEHGYVFGLINVRCDLTYQQGLRRHWSRQTRYDYYFPVFAMLGEQAVLSKEIFCTGAGIPAENDDLVFGYQERWAEYRYMPSQITGLFRSTAAQSIDPWHLAEKFVTRPALNYLFIRDPAHDTVERSIAVGDEAGGQQFLFDAFFDIRAARPMPLYSVPGLIDHF